MCGGRRGLCPEGRVGGTYLQSGGQGWRDPSLGRPPEGQGVGSWLAEWIGVGAEGSGRSLTTVC